MKEPLVAYGFALIERNARFHNRLKIVFPCGSVGSTPTIGIISIRYLTIKNRGSFNTTANAVVFHFLENRKNQIEFEKILHGYFVW